MEPTTCIVLGSGLGGLVDFIVPHTILEYRDIPGFPLSHAVGHAGKLILGELAGVPVAALSGRAHLYEGHSMDAATFGVRLIRQLGANTLVLSNAAGGLNPRFQKGDLVAIDQHLDLLFRSENIDGISGDVRASDVPGRFQETYCPELLRVAQHSALNLGFQLPSGTYLATLGPTYETRAEYRFFRRIGADMVGMSTVPEAMVGRKIGYRVAAFSVITNEARPDAISKTTHDEVLDVARVAQTRLVPLVQSLVAAS